MQAFHRARLAALVVAGLAAAAAPASAQTAQNYPARPIRMIIPFTAGSATDLLARRVAPKMSENWSQQVVVDNRGGAGGTLAAGIVAKANPDGYTLLVHSIAFAMNAAVQDDLQRRVELYRRAEQLILADVPIIPMWHYTYERLFQPYVRSVEVNGLGDPYIPLRKIWLESPR